MDSTTRLVISIGNFIAIIQNTFISKKKNFSTKLFLLFLGFVIGSLFGTFLPNFPEKINSHIVSIVLIISTIEVINCLVYSSEQRNVIAALDVETPFQFLLLIKTKFFTLLQSVRQKGHITQNFKIKTNLLTEERKKYFYRNVNSFKLGIMLGFFIDAFKVGS
uniref:Hypothetical chloroplast RF20 n=1 Tax=Koliella longiseta TaxID=33092 RepID=A0A097KLI6_9CHLO|nr:hypothetical chloroplast RF20 [Koliella longiseta]AIT94033.1 hypothetical chloroplast RF20 [Koliella longiseta]